MSNRDIDISFIIPHKGREELLQATLDSIARQNYPLDKVEVLVVTQNTQLMENTLPPAEALNCRVLYRPEQDTISSLRNHGAANARGEFLAFLDADIGLSTNWILAMRAELENNSGRVLTSAVQYCRPTAPVLEQIRTALSNANVNCYVRFLPGRNLFMRRDTFEASGGFPEHLATCEDYYFTDKVSKLGQLYYSSQAHYEHLGEDKVLSEMYKKEIWRGQSNLKSIKGRPIPLSEWPSFLVPIWILLFAMATLISLLLGETIYTLASLMFTLAPVAAYSLRLYRVAGGTLGLIPIVQFYSVYFPARIVGTLTGLFTTIRI